MASSNLGKCLLLLLAAFSLVACEADRSDDSEPAWRQAYQLKEEMDCMDEHREPVPPPTTDAQALARLKREVWGHSRWNTAEAEYIATRRRTGWEVGHVYYIIANAYAE